MYFIILQNEPTSPNVLHKIYYYMYNVQMIVNIIIIANLAVS